MTESTECKLPNKEAAGYMLHNGKFEDYRVMFDCPFMGILFRCRWEDREQVKEILKEALEIYIK